MICLAGTCKYIKRNVRRSSTLKTKMNTASRCIMILVEIEISLKIILRSDSLRVIRNYGCPNGKALVVSNQKADNLNSLKMILLIL